MFKYGYGSGTQQGYFSTMAKPYFVVFKGILIVEQTNTSLDLTKQTL